MTVPRITSSANPHEEGGQEANIYQRGRLNLIGLKPDKLTSNMQQKKKLVSQIARRFHHCCHRGRLNLIGLQPDKYTSTMQKNKYWFRKWQGGFIIAAIIWIP